MNPKKKSENVQPSSKQTICNYLKTSSSSSSSNVTSLKTNTVVRERSKVRAASAKYYDVASTILGGSTDVEELFLNSAKNGNYRRLEQLLQQSNEIGLNINCVDKRTGNTALIWAARRGHTKVVELLLRHEADATLHNYEAQTALETAFLPVKTIILDWVGVQDELNEGLLLQAAWQGNLSAVRKVLRNKSNINMDCRNSEGLTPLMLVCRDMQLFERLSSQLNRLYNPIQVAEELIKGKADIHVTDNNGRSCLHYASQSHAGSAEDLIVTLVSGGLDIELCDKHQLTPIHVAAKAGNTGSLVALVNKGSDVNAKGFAGLTPLHMTAFKDHHATAIALLNYGADVTITDDHGLTPVDLAKTKKMKHTLKDAWLIARKSSNYPADDAGSKNNAPGIDKNACNNNLPTQTQTQTTKPKVLANVDRCKQVGITILQEVEALKSPPLALQRETTRMLGTTRAKILPEITRSKSPDNYCKASQAVMDSKLSLSRRCNGLHRSLEELKNEFLSEKNSVLDLGIGKRVRCRPPEFNFNRDLPAGFTDIQKDSDLKEKVSCHLNEVIVTPPEILRCHSILKEEFILEESHPKEISSSSDLASSISSGSQSSSSPRDLSVLQSSPTRSIRHDHILSTLQEQRVSTDFLVSDSSANTDTKPVIMKPHKRLRRRSDNSLSSSIESDIDDLRTEKSLTRSNSLRKSNEGVGCTNLELTTLARPFAVFKSQSMESISPKIQAEVSFDWLGRKSDDAKSNSDGHLDSASKDKLQIVNSDPCQTTSNEKLVQSQVVKNPANCIKQSKKLLIEPFIGKTRALPKSKVDSCKCLSLNAFKKKDNINWKIEQKSHSDTQLKSLTLNEKDSLTAISDVARPKVITSVQEVNSEEKAQKQKAVKEKNVVVKTSSTTNNGSIHSSSTSLKYPVSKTMELKTTLLLHKPTEMQTCRVAHTQINSEKLKTVEKKYAKREVHQPIAAETIHKECDVKSNQNKSLHFNLHKNMQSETNVTFVAISPSKQSYDSSAHESAVGNSDVERVPPTSAELLNPNGPPAVCKTATSESISCAKDTNCEELKVSKCQNPIPVQSGPKLKQNNQEPNSLLLSNQVYFLASKPNMQQKYTCADVSNGDAAKQNIEAHRRESYAAISTPVIVNPFEEFLQPYVRALENSTQDVLTKAKTPICSKVTNKNIKKAVASSKKRQNNSILRHPSDGKKQGSKMKDLKIEKESRPKSGRKSAKGQRCTKIQTNIENETNSKSVKMNNTVLSCISENLTTSQTGKSKIDVSTNLHVDSCDSDLSLELYENEHSSHVNDYISRELLNGEPIHASDKHDTDYSPRLEKQEHEKKSPLSKNHSVAASNCPLIKQEATKDTHNNHQQSEKDKNHYNINIRNCYVSTDFSSENVHESDDIMEEALNVLSPILEIPTLPRTAYSVLDDELICKEELPSGDISKFTEDRNKQVLEDADVTSNYSQEDLSSEHLDSNSINEETEDKTSIKYEYTPSGKIVRSQSLKEFYSTNKQKPGKKFIESHSQQNSVDKNVNKQEDIDEIIEEILSSTAPSLSSTKGNVKLHEIGLYTPGTHSLAESDRNLLLKMSQSVFASPFHATLSFTSKTSSPEGVQDTLDVNAYSKSSSSENSEHQNKHSPSLVSTQSSNVSQSQDCVATSVLNKLPPSIRSSLKTKGAPSVKLGRSASSIECRRHNNELKSRNRMTEEETKQFVKILSNFKHMGLQASSNCIERSGGSAKCLSRKVRHRNEGSNNHSTPPSALASSSFRSKGKFQEIKDAAEIRISLEANSALPSTVHKKEQQSLDFYQSSTVGSEKSSITDIQCDEVDTIQWKKGNVLGRGAFGTVWCGLTSEGELIAVKQIELTTMDKSKAEHEYEQVQEEVELLKTLEHVNIVSYLGTSLEDNVVSIFMQFIPGGSIANILARFGALEESVFRHYTKQILEGVQYLHENDIIHRDIKGANVMLMPNGVIKLIDFGCAKRLCINLSISQTELLKSMNGTPYWMAPEVVNESGHGKKSDIWSIGCTVFEMATRKPPWADMNPMAAIFAIGSSSRPVPTLVSTFSHDARDFVSQCMTRDQDARPGALELQEHPFITKQCLTAKVCGPGLGFIPAMTSGHLPEVSLCNRLYIRMTKVSED